MIVVAVNTLTDAHHSRKQLWYQDGLKDKGQTFFSKPADIRENISKKEKWETSLHGKNNEKRLFL